MIVEYASTSRHWSCLGNFDLQIIAFNVDKGIMPSRVACVAPTMLHDSQRSLFAVLCKSCHLQASYRAWTSAPMPPTLWQRAPIPLQLQCMTLPQAQLHSFCRGIKAASHRCSTSETYATIAKQFCMHGQFDIPVHNYLSRPRAFAEYACDIISNRPSGTLRTDADSL